MNDPIRKQLWEKAARLPEKPGIYQFVDREGKILYIGKAKNLKKRVTSYFSREKNGKTKMMIGRSHDIRHIVVDTESDALLLENSLVKKYQPRYNIQLKDDKSFPWIVIKNERFPRVFSTRKVIHDGSEYFGPYTSAVMVRTLISLVRKIYPLRTCNYNLSEENIEKQKFRPCLEYHLGNCKGPCVKWQEEADYMESTGQIRQILRGNIGKVMSFLEERMKEKAAEYRYEEAAALKEKLDILGKFQSKSTVVSPKINQVEVFSLCEDEHYAYVNYLKVFHGAVINAYTVEVKKNLQETREEILLSVITELRQRTGSRTREILVPFDPGMEMDNARFHIPHKGDKKKLLDLSLRNAHYYRKERQESREQKQRKDPEKRVLEIIKNDLKLRSMPVLMECFDNSNFQGSYPVAACVVFRNARPSRQEYRHYNIKTVQGINDVASIGEVVTRRYSRLLREKRELPQLVVIDGGKGQVNAAVNSLDKLGLRGKVAVIGIAKRLEEIYYPGDSLPLYLDKRSETLRVIQHMRNEAHRFGIGFHRRKRSGPLTVSYLEQLKGIGKESVKKLYDRFQTWEEIKNAGYEEWMQILGKKRAEILKRYFQEEG